MPLLCAGSQIDAMSMSVEPYPNPSSRSVIRIVHPPMHFYLRPFAGSWRLSEETGMHAGIFATLSAALTYARGESRCAPGSSTVIELDSEPVPAHH